MSLRVVTPYINTNIPGAYPNVVVQSQPTGLGASGILVIMGEAAGGPSYSQIALKNNFFGPGQLAQVQQQYISGNIVDAMSALAAPSDDPDITGSANQIYILKTNTSAKASSVIGVTSVIFTVSGANATNGAVYSNNGNNFTVTSTIASGASLTANGTHLPTVSGTLTKVSGTGDTTIPFSSYVVQNSYGSLADSNYGVNGNLYKYQILSEDAEVAPTVSGVAVPAFGSGLNGLQFTLHVNGGAASVIGPISGSPANIAALVTELNSLLPSGSGVGFSQGAIANSLKLTASGDSSAWGRGYGKSFELIDSTPGDLAALGLVPALTVSSQEPIVEVSIVRPDINVNQTISASADVALEVGYSGTATLSISKITGLLTTSVSGDADANLSIPLANFSTIADLAAYIASQTGYTAACPPNAQQLPPSALDQVSNVGIASIDGLMPGRIKDAAYNFQNAMGTSVLVFTPGTLGVTGLPAPINSYVFLTGGALGGTAPTDIVNCLTQMAGIACNIIVPLFSEDASEDILLGETDPSSTYTIAAINAAVKNHCITYSTPSLKKNRICILSFMDNTASTYINAKAAAQSLGNYRCSLAMQQVMQVNSAGSIQTFQPWYAAALAAGMQAGGFYKSITNKAANIVSYIDPAGFDSGDPDNVSDALSSGLLFMAQDTGRAGYWVSDQTTYGFDSNFVYNSIQAVYDTDLIAIDLAMSFFQQFCGQSLADVSASSGLSFLTQKMDGYKKLKLLASSSDAPLGFKNASIQIDAPEMDVAVEIKLATAIYFIPININVSQVQQSAS